MKIESLTFLRFIAALIVVNFHFGKKATGFTGFLISGPEMVTFFFVMSGFVMVLAYYFRKDVSASSYWWARVARIVPVYVLSLAILILAVGHYDTIALILSLTFLQSLIPPYPLALNDPAWAISVEMFFYFTFPFILWAIKKRTIAPVYLILTGLSFWLLTQIVLTHLRSSGFYMGFPSVSHDLIYYFPLSHFCSFLLGVSGGYLIVNKKYVISSKWISALLVISTSILVVLALNNKGFIKSSLGFSPAFASSFFAPLFLFFIIVISVSHKGVTNFLSNKVFILLGEVSYALYLLQKPVYLLYSKHLSPVLGLNKANNYYLYILLLLSLSIIIFYLIERPAKNLIRYRLPALINKRMDSL